MLRTMTEYKVRALETGATGDLEKECNRLAQDGWRLVSTTTYTEGTFKPRLYLFFEREKGEPQQQNSWREQHRRQD